MRNLTGETCATTLLNMGRGASMNQLGITEENVLERTASLCKCITSLGRVYGLDVDIDTAQ